MLFEVGVPEAGVPVAGELVGGIASWAGEPDLSPFSSDPSLGSLWTAAHVAPPGLGKPMSLPSFAILFEFILGFFSAVGFVIQFTTIHRIKMDISSST